jgi:uncharacterized repeat protein (TIGR01451 family)
MKAKITILILVLGLTFSAKAQTWVTIPDTNFVYYLYNHYSSIMSGYQMDITSPDISNIVTLSMDGWNIHDLTGVQYFTSLTQLICSANQITVLPPLPNTIIWLECGDNQLTSLGTLPPSLQYLSCGGNPLGSLPQLPNTLTTLYCPANQLTSLPTLPNSLIYLFCNMNQLTSLPTLPPSLGELVCSDNPLTSLPTLPNSIVSIDCRHDQLNSLPALPTSLRYFYGMYNSLTSLPAIPNLVKNFYCDHNQLTGIPALPPDSLQTFFCEYNQLTSLPVLPHSLYQLNCEHNQLVNLPTNLSYLYYLECGSNQLTNIPATLSNNLRELRCDSNNISCFPVFPNSIMYVTGSYSSLTIYGNPFTCLPNYIPAMDSLTLTYPLCVTGDLINNPNGCNGVQGIVGFTYLDNNANCIDDANDSLYRNIPLKLYDSGNNLLQQTYTGLNGIYSFADTLGTYTVKVDTAGKPFTFQCPNPGMDSTVNITLGNPIVSNVNFDIICKPGFDIGVQSINRMGYVFPGIMHHLGVWAGDMSHWYNFNCAAGVSGQVQVTINGPATYYGISLGSLTPIVAGNVFTYNIADFGTINNVTDFGLELMTDTTAQMGDSICVDVTVTPNAGDNNIGNNTKHFCYGVFTSYDPNLKETYPMQVQPGFNDYFTYTIHFQNTGSAPAINIQLQDTLDANLDLNTFQVINYSHYCTSMLTGNKLSFNFPNIQLPDSTSNFDGSQGYVQYRIKPLANLPGGTMIHNKASIYFDYNPAVVTNTTTNEFMLSIGINEFRISDFKFIRIRLHRKLLFCLM